MGNDSGLGANKATPAIAFVLGDQLTDVMNQLITTGIGRQIISELEWKNWKQV